MGNLENEAALLYLKATQLVEEQKNSEDGLNSPLVVPVDYKNEVFRFIDKVNLSLMEDKDNFFGYFLFQMEKEIRFDITSPTAVNFKKAKYVIYFNPLLFLSMTIKQMESSIKHEILHIVSLHMIRVKDLRKNYSKLALNLAMDIVVNTYLVPLPTDAISLDLINIKYDLYLVPFESLEYYADEIQQALNKSDEVSDQVDPDGQKGEQIDMKFDPMNTHDIWEESDEIDDRMLTKFTEKYIDSSQKGDVANYLQGMIASLKNSEHELPWNWYLKKLVGSVACEPKKTTTRRNRRQPERLDLRGQLRNYKSKIFIGLDISGSISDDEFKQAMKEVLQIVRCYKHEITIIECDDKIRRTYTVKTMQDIKARLAIRGGTCYAPVIEYANSKKVDLLLYFTDGKGEDKLRTIPKGYKVLWVISGQGEELSLSEPYGIVKRLKPIQQTDTFVALYDLERGGYSMNKQEEINLEFE